MPLPLVVAVPLAIDTGADVVAVVAGGFNKPLKTGNPLDAFTGAWEGFTEHGGLVFATVEGLVTGKGLYAAPDAICNFMDGITGKAYDESYEKDKIKESEKSPLEKFQSKLETEMNSRIAAEDAKGKKKEDIEKPSVLQPTSNVSTTGFSTVKDSLDKDPLQKLEEFISKIISKFHEFENQRSFSANGFYDSLNKEIDGLNKPIDNSFGSLSQDHGLASSLKPNQNEMSIEYV